MLRSLLSILLLSLLLFPLSANAQPQILETGIFGYDRPIDMEIVPDGSILTLTDHSVIRTLSVEDWKNDMHYTALNADRITWTDLVAGPDYGAWVLGYDWSNSEAPRPHAMIGLVDMSEFIWMDDVCPLYLGQDDRAGDMLVTVDGYLVVLVSSAETLAGDEDLVIAKVDPHPVDGEYVPIWSHRTGQGYTRTYPLSVVQAPDGGFYVVSFHKSWYPTVERLFTARYDANGNQLWSGHFIYDTGPTWDDVVSEECSIVTPDGRWLWFTSRNFMGSIPPGVEVAVLSTDSPGVQQVIEIPLGDAEDYDYEFHEVKQLPNSNILVTGSWEQDDFLCRKLHVMMLDTNLNILWQRLVGTNNAMDDLEDGVSVATADGIVLTSGDLSPRGSDAYGYKHKQFIASLGGDVAGTKELTLLPPGYLTFSTTGGSFPFVFELLNHGPATQYDVWVQVRDLENRYSATIDGYQNVTFAEGVTELDVQQTVPSPIPPGRYEYSVLLGDYPFHADVIAHLTFTIEEDEAPPYLNEMPQSGWVLTGDFHGSEPADATFPADFRLMPVTPNPFNAMATLTVQVPDAAELTVAVYNVMGQQVALINQGQVSAGIHELVFNASHLASGLYFVRATVPGQMDQVRKVMLVR